MKERGWERERMKERGSKEVVDFVAECIEKAPKISSLCEELFDHCLAPDTTGDGTGCDNMTAVIVQFKREGSGEEAAKVNGEASASTAICRSILTHKKIETRR